MGKMKLAGEWLPQNVGRPRDRCDFDLPAGSHTYAFTRASESSSTWQTSRNNSLLGFGISLVLWPVVIYFATADLGYAGLALWLKVVLGIIGVIVLAATIAITGMIGYRRRLIVDHAKQELRFCKWSDRPYHVLPFNRIRSLSFENIQHVSGSDIPMQGGGTSITTSTQVLVAELNDGRIASIAFSPAPGLFQAITSWTDEDMHPASEEVDDPDDDGAHT